MLNSWYRKLGHAELPYAGRRMYMHSFDIAAPRMALGYQDYLPVVAALCAAAGATRGTAHMTVDEREVPAGRSQRRPGPHVDGCFVADGWKHVPTWLHYCNRVPVPRMPVIVAASVAGCVAWSGEYDLEPTETGDLSHGADLLGAGELLLASVGYLLSPDCVHESLVFTRPVRRTFLRIALPVELGLA